MTIIHELFEAWYRQEYSEYPEFEKMLKPSPEFDGFYLYPETENEFQAFKAGYEHGNEL